MPSTGQTADGKVETRQAIAISLDLSVVEAVNKFMQYRWPPLGKIVCPYCDVSETPYITGRLRQVVGFCRYRCKQCHRDFTPFTGTVLHHPKLPPQIYLAAITAAKDTTMSARQFAMLTRINPRSAYYLLAKLRITQGNAA